MPLNLREGKSGQVSMLRYLLGAPIANQVRRALRTEQKEKISKQEADMQVDDNRSDMSRKVTLVQRRRDILDKRRKERKS